MPNNELAARMKAGMKDFIRGIPRDDLWGAARVLLEELDAVEAELGQAISDGNAKAFRLSEALGDMQEQLDAAIKERDALRVKLSRFEDCCKCDYSPTGPCLYCTLRSRIALEEVKEQLRDAK